MDCCVASWCRHGVSMPVSESGHWKAQATPAGAAFPHGLLITDTLSFPVHFRYVVFHPFLDEILIGSIKGCSPEGVHGNVGPESSHETREHAGGRWRGWPASL